MQTGRQVVRYRRLSDQIYDILLQRVRAGEISLEQVLTEPKVSEELQTSRTPAREALFRLASNKVLVEDGKGYRLPTLSQQDIVQMAEARQLLETEIVRLAGARITQDEVAELRVAADAEQQAINQSAHAFIVANSNFRDLLFSIGGNSYLAELAALLNDRSQAYRHITLSDPENRERVAAAHKGLVEAFARADIDDAILIYRSMMRLAREAYST